MSGMPAEKNPRSDWDPLDDANRERPDETREGPEARQPTVLLPPDKQQPGFLRRWWSNPRVRRILGISLSLAAIGGVIAMLALRLQQSPAQSGSTGSGASSEAGGVATPTVEDASASERFAVLQDSLETAIGRYQDRREQFDADRAGARDTTRMPVDCDDLASVYQIVDDRFVTLAAEFRSNRALLGAEQRTRFRDLFDRVASVNRDFDESGCPRPE